MVFGSPPSTTIPSEPFGILTRLGARSRHLAETRCVQTSGLRSRCESAEIRRYERDKSCLSFLTVDVQRLHSGAVGHGEERALAARSVLVAVPGPGRDYEDVA